MMKDPFFTATQCQRCGGSLRGGRIMSMYNEQVICMACKKAETQRSDYRDAVDADHRQIVAGNYNFPGIGFADNE